jgi:LCP family protein required for cell wall assembly
MGLRGKHAMSDTSTQDFFTRQAAEARGPEPQGPPKRKRRRLKRIAIAAGVSLAVTVGGVAGGGYLYVNNLAGSVQRLPHIAALDAKEQAAFPATHGGMNVLLTASGFFPGANVQTGLIEVLHLDANRQGGAVISFPANTLVRVPGHGRQELGNVNKIGGPSLLIRTLEQLIGIRISHYSRMTYSGLPGVVGSMGGVNVVVPYPTTSFGIPFHAGVNHITARTALAYVRQPLVSQVGRTALQENLFRAILNKIARNKYFVATDFHVLYAVVHAMSVDSSFTNAQLVALALSLGHLQGSDGVSIDVPTVGSPHAGINDPVFLDPRLSPKLFRAIRHDQVMEFAHRYPGTVTPIAPG